MASRRKVVIWSSVALVVVLLLALPKLMEQSDAPGAGGPPGGGGGGRGGGGPLVATVALVEQMPLADVLSATGTLLPWESVEVSAEVAGRIVALGFQEGAYVRQGQTLATLNTDVLQAELRATQTRYNLASVQAQRQRQLFEIGGLARAALDQAESEAQVLAAQMAETRAEIARRRIAAPFSGKVGLRAVSAGAYVSPGTRIATLNMTSPLRLEFTVPEAYASQVRVGAPVEFTVPGESGVYTGQVYAVEPGISQTTRALTVRARVGNAGDVLTPGAYAEVRLVLTEVPDALVVPPASVVPGVDSAAVFVVREGKAVRRSVRTGIRTPDRVQVLGDLTPGDTVLTSGVDQVRPGQSVRVAGAGRGDGVGAPRGPRPDTTRRDTARAESARPVRR